MKSLSKSWQIDRRIPIAVLMALILQLATALIWATELDARVAYMENQWRGNVDNREKLGRIEERLNSIKDNVDVIRKQLDQLTYRMIRKQEG